VPPAGGEVRHVVLKPGAFLVQGIATYPVAAQAWLDQRLNGTAPVGLPWPSLLAFIFY
jgi:hypothetical protein